jgi:hypothetical protein
MLVTQLSHSLLNLPQVVAGKCWEQVVLHLKVEAACMATSNLRECKHEQ